jgi:hypothetical protein
MSLTDWPPFGSVSSSRRLTDTSAALPPPNSPSGSDLPFFGSNFQLLPLVIVNSVGLKSASIVAPFSITSLALT